MLQNQNPLCELAQICQLLGEIKTGDSTHMCYPKCQMEGNNPFTPVTIPFPKISFPLSDLILVLHPLLNLYYIFAGRLFLFQFCVLLNFTCNTETKKKSKECQGKGFGCFTLALLTKFSFAQLDFLWPKIKSPTNTPNPKNSDANPLGT